MKDRNFFAMLSRMKYINRWGLMRNTINENIAGHSLDVAIIAHGLAVISNVYFGGSVSPERVAVLALFHDTTEIITGDMPTPVKYFAPEIREAYKSIERIAANRLLDSMPEPMRGHYGDVLLENEEEKDLWRFVKAADKISALIKCIEEKRMGNMDFDEAGETTYNTIVDMHMKEADYFLENFLPSYSLTLDGTVQKRGNEDAGD